MQALTEFAAEYYILAKQTAWGALESVFGGKFGDDVRTLLMASLLGFVVWKAVNPQDWREDNRAQNKIVRRKNRMVLRGVVRLQALYRGGKARGKWAAKDE
jgi:hypothetical protein